MHLKKKINQCHFHLIPFSSKKSMVWRGGGGRTVIPDTQQLVKTSKTQKCNFNLLEYFAHLQTGAFLNINDRMKCYFQIYLL